MKTLRLFLLLLVVVFLAGCASNGGWHEGVSVVPLNDFWVSHNEILPMMIDLQNAGFEYGYDADDISFYTNKPKATDLFFYEKYGNCLDYSNFLTEYIEFKTRGNIKTCDGYKLILMIDGNPVKKWHYIVRVFDGGVLWEQSNVTYGQHPDEATSEMKWRLKGFNIFTVIKEWKSQ